MIPGAFVRVSGRLTAVGLAAFWSLPAVAQGMTGDGTAVSFIRLLSERRNARERLLDALGRHLAGFGSEFSWTAIALIVGIVVAGLLAEYVARQLLMRVRVAIFERHAGASPLRAFTVALLLDLVALLALFVAARLLTSQLPAGTVASATGNLVLQTLLYWRGFNLVFRAWLRPNTPEGRIAPVDDATAQRLLLGMGVVILLPAVARLLVAVLAATKAPPGVMSAGVVIIAPITSAGLLWVVWHWHRDVAAWLEAMIGPRDVFRPIKTAMAHGWWVGGMVFYACAALAACYAALTGGTTAARGLAIIESTFIGLLLIETLIFRLTRHLPSELPTLGDLIAGCVRLAVRLTALIIMLEALMVYALGTMTPLEWAPHAAHLKVAALSAFGAYALWRGLRYRMDAYIAANPLPAAGVIEVDDDAPAAASRLSTLMPVLRVVASVTILIVGTLLVLSQLGVNITPLIAGASVLGLAISFGSQSLVRDIVSGMFFLVEDSFRVGEYLDSGRVKGTVEGFSIRSIRLRHQNGQLHIVPFGQLGHITNFSRDWTTVKFNLSFRHDTDIELLRKTVKKIGLDMMEEPAYHKELIQPLKMQGIVDIKDAALVVRFKFTAKPKNPSLIQRTAIRRMYEAFPSKNIHFALPPVMFPGLAPTPPPQAQAT